MQLLPPQIEKIAGVSFSKLLGTGSGFGFSLKPDFGTYALLIKWQSEQDKKHFFQKEQLFEELNNKSENITTYFLEELGAHGSWYGKNPFEQEATYNGKQIAVITRARINLSKLPSFWRNVPKASKAIKQANGLAFTKGIGEWPLIEQATFSVWDNLESMKKYAYSDIHKEIIGKVKQENWYKEELFSRFNVLDKIEH